MNASFKFDWIAGLVVAVGMLGIVFFILFLLWVSKREMEHRELNRPHLAKTISWRQSGTFKKL